MGFTNYLRDSVLDEVWGGVDYVPAANLYVGLSTTAPNDNGANITEPTNGYARVQVANTSGNWPAAVDGIKNNGIEIEFPEATGSWGTITHFFISDANVGGNIIGWGALDIAKEINTGDTARFAVGDMTISLQ